MWDKWGEHKAGGAMVVCWHPVEVRAHSDECGWNMTSSFVCLTGPQTYSWEPFHTLSLSVTDFKVSVCWKISSESNNREVN